MEVCNQVCRKTTLYAVKHLLCPTISKGLARRELGVERQLDEAEVLVGCGCTAHNVADATPANVKSYLVSAFQSGRMLRITELQEF
jgi:hypothetical protein